MNPKLTDALKHAITNQLTVKQLEQNLANILTTEDASIHEAAEILLQYQDYLISSSNELSNNFNIHI